MAALRLAMPPGARSIAPRTNSILTKPTDGKPLALARRSNPWAFSRERFPILIAVVSLVWTRRICDFTARAYNAGMSFTTLISADELAAHLDDAPCTVVDARFSLNDPGRGYRDYLAAHIPGAIYVHLDDDLSGPIVKGKTGRHPLPSVETFADRLGRWGIDDDTQVTVYDDAGGAIASRLWWMLRWLGHDAVAVLDGGMPRWVGQGRPTVGGNEKHEPRTFTATPRPDWILNAPDILERLTRLSPV